MYTPASSSYNSTIETQNPYGSGKLSNSTQAKSPTYSGFGVGSTHKNEYSTSNSYGRTRGLPNVAISTTNTRGYGRDHDTFASIYGLNSTRRVKRSIVSPDGQIVKSSGYNYKQSRIRSPEEVMLEKTRTQLQKLDIRNSPKRGVALRHIDPIPPSILIGPSLAQRRRASQVSLTKTNSKSLSSERLQLPSTSVSPSSRGNSPILSPLENVAISHSSRSRPQLLASSLTTPKHQLDHNKSSYLERSSQHEERQRRSSSRKSSSRSKQEVHTEIKTLLLKDCLTLPENFVSRPRIGGKRHQSTFANLGNTVSRHLLIVLSVL